MRRVLLVALIVLLVAGSAGCSVGEAGNDRRLSVLAAASLTGTFEELAEQFEDQYGVDVRLSFESSATLARQAVEGAPADVLATADEPTMSEAVDGGATAAEPTLFARNDLVLITPAGNPAGIESVADLSGTDWVMCVETAPCGRVATAVLEGAGAPVDPVSLEADVKAVLTKVAADEADAGLVYATDARAAGAEVEAFPVAGSERHRTSYLVAPLVQAGDSGYAGAWIDLLESEAGREVLARAGFTLP